MTDAYQNLTEKKWDLGFLYEMVQQAIETSDLDQALEIANKGIMYAIEYEKVEWAAKFREIRKILNGDSDSTANSIGSKSAFDFTLLSGVGPSVAQKLVEGGITTLQELAHISPQQLSKVKGFGLNSAKKIIEKAKEYQVDSPSETIDNKSSSTETIDFDKQKIPTKSEIELEDFEVEVVPEEKTPYQLLKENPREKEVQSLKYEPVEEKLLYPSEEKINDFEDKELMEKIKIVEDPNDGILETNYSEISSPVLENTNTVRVETAPSSTTSIRERFIPSFESEELESNEFQELHHTISANLETAGFMIIPKQSNSLTLLFRDLDFLACKRVPVKNFTEILIFLPIKICSFEGQIILDENNIGYHSSTNNGNQKIYLSQIHSATASLIQFQEMLFNELVQEGELLSFLKHYFQLDLKVQKSVENKKLFLRAGPIQYKLLIEPILLCKHKPAFTEKSVPFAYQKHCNLHVISFHAFPELLYYLEKKYCLIEEHSNTDTSMKEYQTAINSFRSKLKLFSYPFLAYVGFFILILWSQNPLLIKTFNGIGMGAIGTYTIILIYLYYHTYRKKVEMTKKFNTPYYQHTISLKETDLILIHEEFSDEMMSQFGYECFGKNHSYQVIQKAEEKCLDNALSHITPRKKDFQEVYEKEVKTKPVTESSDILKKYSSFLED